MLTDFLETFLLFLEVFLDCFRLGKSDSKCLVRPSCESSSKHFSSVAFLVTALKIVQ